MTFLDTLYLGLGCSLKLSSNQPPFVFQIPSRMLEEGYSSTVKQASPGQLPSALLTS